MQAEPLSYDLVFVTLGYSRLLSLSCIGLPQSHCMLSLGLVTILRWSISTIFECIWLKLKLFLVRILIWSLLLSWHFALIFFGAWKVLPGWWFVFLDLTSVTIPVLSCPSVKIALILLFPLCRFWSVPLAQAISVNASCTAFYLQCHHLCYIEWTGAIRHIHNHLVFQQKHRYGWIHPFDPTWELRFPS